MAEAESSILIVDDDTEDLHALKGALESLGCELHTVSDPHDVLPIVYRERPDVVVLDALLPGLSGFDLCKQIKTDAELRGTQVVIITGVYLRQTYRQEALQQFKADGFLTKPFRAPELQRLIVQLLSRKTRKPQSSFLSRLGLPGSVQASKKRGLFGRLFGKEDEAPTRIAPVPRVRATEDTDAASKKSTEEPPAPRSKAVATAASSVSSSQTAKPEEVEMAAATGAATKPSPSAHRDHASETREVGNVKEEPRGATEKEAAPSIELEASKAPPESEKKVPDEAAFAPPSDAETSEIVPDATPEVEVSEESKAIDEASITQRVSEPGPQPLDTAAAGAEPGKQDPPAVETESESPSPVEKVEEVAKAAAAREGPEAAHAPALEGNGGAADAPSLDAAPATEEDVAWSTAPPPPRAEKDAASEAAPTRVGGATPESPVAANDAAKTLGPRKPETRMSSATEPPAQEAQAETRAEPAAVARVLAGDVPVYQEEEFHLQLKRELSKCRRVDRPLTLILIRVIDLSQIVELFGKGVRESVLWHLAEQAMASLREVDLVGMLTSKDLVALTAFASDKYGGGRVVSRLRKSMQKHPFRVSEELPPIVPALEFGMASFPDDGDEVWKLIEKARKEIRKA